MYTWASLMAQWVKNLPAVKETWEAQVQSLGSEEPLEKEMATHSSIFAWEIPRTGEGHSPKGHEESHSTEVT